ncbi:MAG: hypothetical protein IPL47_06890 [Phyllobacteriaceae bacterium]|nr:hypothetical protein [Phyllobacteriaceae bacterium]
MAYRAFSLVAISLALAGCATEDGLYSEGVTTRAGNAMAANTVMQMVDPWQVGVDETDLRTPADRGDGDGDSASPPPVAPTATQ